MPRPFSILHYFWRHKRKSLALVVGLILSMSVIAFVGGMVTSINDNVRVARTYSKHFSVVSALTREGVSSVSVEAMRAHPDIEHVYTLRQLSLQVPVLVGDTSVPVFVLGHTEIAELAARLGVHLLDGRLPKNAGEIVLSKQMATAKKWTVGSLVGSQVKEGEALRGAFTVVGLLDNSPWLALAVDVEPASFVADYLVVAKVGKRAAADAWLEEHVAIPKTVRAVTQRYVENQIDNDTASFGIILTMISGMVTITNTVVTTLLAYIFIAQRRPEFALYMVLGQSLGQVLRRVLMEVSLILFGGWALGIAVTTALFWWMKQAFFEPKGLSLSVINPTVILHTAPSPLLIGLVLAVVLTLLLVRFDYISVIEGRE